MKTQTLFIVFLFLGINSGISQNTAVFKKIEDIGYKFITPLKTGEIDQFKNRKPPVNTWTYSALETYKKHLDSKKFVLYGSFIMPTTKKEVYNFNYYALRKSGQNTLTFLQFLLLFQR